MSDHSFITATADLQFQHGQPTNSIRRRRWRDFDYDKFCDDLSSSALLCDPPRDAVGLFTCYHDTLQALVDKHAPFAVHKLRAHPTAPWYDLNCHLAKTEARRLERIYRRDKSDRNRHVWRRQSRILRFTLHEKYIDYWSNAIKSNIGDSSALWSKINTLLKIPQASMISSHTAADFASHFRSKVDTIRANTSGATSIAISSRCCSSLSVLRETTADEIIKIVGRAPAKHCSLDPAPTSLVKRLLPLLAGTLATMVNTSLREGVFPDALKHAIVRPRLKNDAQSR